MRQPFVHRQSGAARPGRGWGYGLHDSCGCGLNSRAITSVLCVAAGQQACLLLQRRGTPCTSNSRNRGSVSASIRRAAKKPEARSPATVNSTEWHKLSLNRQWCGLRAAAIAILPECRQFPSGGGGRRQHRYHLPPSARYFAVTGFWQTHDALASSPWTRAANPAIHRFLPAADSGSRPRKAV